MSIVNDIYYMMKINLLWILFTIEGGIILGIIPATITVFYCIRDRLKNGYDGGVYAEFKEAYWRVFKSSILLTLGFSLFGLILVLSTALLNGVGQTNIVLEITLRIGRLLIVLMGIFFFPVYSHFDLHGNKVWIQPFLFLFICPIQVVVTVIVIAVSALLYMIDPLLIFFMGISLPAYFIMGMMLKKFEKLQEKIPYIQEVQN